MKIEVSTGEIVDKLTILEIKEEKCYDESKLLNIKQELEYLRNIVSSLNVPIELINSLREINNKLWNIEDDIRICEKNFIFDDEFISLARLVYHTNDERFKLKSQISQVTNSNFKEEKIHPSYE
jgi:hypothetical protein